MSAPAVSKSDISKLRAFIRVNEDPNAGGRVNDPAVSIVAARALYKIAASKSSIHHYFPDYRTYAQALKSDRPRDRGRNGGLIKFWRPERKELVPRIAA
jgi:hypothetical protein